MLEDYLVYIVTEELKLLVTHHIQTILTFIRSFTLIIWQCKENIFEYFKFYIILFTVEKRKHRTKMIIEAIFFFSTVIYCLYIGFFIIKRLPYFTFLMKIWPFKNAIIWSSIKILGMHFCSNIMAYSILLDLINYTISLWNKYLHSLSLSKKF